MTYRPLLALAITASLAPACVAEPVEDVGDDEDELQADDGQPEEDAFSCDTLGETRPCASEHYDVSGTETCTDYGDGVWEWSQCVYDSEPSCGEFYEWNGSCCIDIGLHACCDYDTECNTPLVLAFDGAPVRYITEMRGSFDLTGRGVSLASDWPTGSTPWLVLDRDGDGRITSGAELFGSATRLRSGELATNGFEALAELDDDGDGRITEQDAVWPYLALWSDADGSRSSSPIELRSVESAGLSWIELDYGVVPRCDTRGNCERERARFGFSEEGRVREGSIVDIHLTTR
jgi:hypothetical protein